MGELMRYSQGKQAVPPRDRKLGKQGKEAYDEVRLRAMQVDGTMALGAHIMEEAIELDRTRLSLAGGDPILNGLLSDIEATALRQAKVIQQSLFNDWRL